MTTAKSRRAEGDSTQPRQRVAQVAGLRPVHEAFAWFRAHENTLSDWQMEITREQSSYVALSAHMDTVFPAGTAIEVRREAGKLLGPGISDNGSGLTALLATVAAMQACRLTHALPIVFIANVGEEGEGDLRGMRHIFSSPQWKDSIAYTLIVDGAGTDTLVNRALGSRRFEVTLRGKGGHSWSDFGEPNPIAILSRAIADFYVNSIPELASMRVDLRSESGEEIERLEAALRRCLADATMAGGAMNNLANNSAISEQAEKKSGESAGAAAGVQCEIRRIGDRPSAELAEDSRILQVMKAVDQHLGIHSRPHCASTDANIPLSLGREAITIGAGGSGGGAHTLNEWFDPLGRDLGLKRILLALLALAE